MKAKIKKAIGNVNFEFEIEGQKGLDVLSIAGFLSSMPDTCKVCNSKNVHLASNKAKGYTFVKVLCEECNARSQIGSYKDGGYFWKEWEEYKKPEESKVSSELPPARKDDEVPPESEIGF